MRLAPLTRLEHNQYHRYDTLAREVSREHDASRVSVLDIGGGKGYLAQFLPQVDYCLAEPDVNGISGVDMPFEKGSFDYVVSCHVLEHVPPGERVQFLDRLCATARRSVILLNPFHVDGTSVTERLRLLLRVTGAAWAKEHLECGLPYLDDVEKFAQRRGISYGIRPNGSITTSTAMVLLEHFAKRSLRIAEFEQVCEFFNTELLDLSTSEQFPNAYLVHFDLQSRA
jgi:SAM-dependent methyltransferase